MSIATITQAIQRGDISTYLAANDNSSGVMYGPRIAAPRSPITIALITDALRWGYDGGAQTDISLREVANYLVWLTGMYGQTAQEILQGDGGGSVIPPGAAVQFPFYIHSSDFESDGVTYLNTKIAGVNLELFIDEYNQQFYPGTGFNYVAGGGFTITLQDFDANTSDYTVRVGRFYSIPT